MARPMPRLEPVTRIESVMYGSFGQIARRLWRAINIESGGGLNAGGAQRTLEHAHAAVVLQRPSGVNGQLAADRKMLGAAFEFARAQQKSERHRVTLHASLAAGKCGDALCHQLDTDPG